MASVETVEIGSSGYSELIRMKFGTLWRGFNREGLLFLLVNLYLFFEYVRPQTLYPALDVVPYNKIIIISTLVLLLIKPERPPVKNPLNVLLACFTIVVLLSSLFAMSPAIAFDKLTVFISWVIIYYLITNIVNSKERFLIFLLLFLLYNLKMSQFAVRGWAQIGFGYGKDGTGGGPGWFLNSGEFGIEMCIFLPLSTYYFLALRRSWSRVKQFFFLLMPATAVAGIISSSSRGALLAGFVVALLMLLKSRKKMLALVLFVMLCAVSYRVLPEEQHARIQSAGTDSTSVNRMERWEKGFVMAKKYPVLGVGYGNWSIADIEMFSGSGDFSHNVFVECVSELGYSGLTVFTLMILFNFVVNRRTRLLMARRREGSDFIIFMSHGLDAALVGFLVGGFFVTVLYYPYFWINTSLTVALNHIAEKEAAS
ncbi:O-antigen ligase family protein [Geomonas edaphica]|uniref:O-antigen ligase family protein n=1 Tax=Geomonas edaphica TaxID=2570226 RepID=UPI0010A7BF77|nr:O-antigen ligase family protein [Geomonas edaphica]